MSPIITLPTAHSSNVISFNRLGEAIVPLESVVFGFGDGVEDTQSRFVSAKIRGVRVACAYMPNGSAVGSEKWHYKLAWMKRLGAWIQKNVDPNEPFALCGDFNVAPEAIDVHAPAEWENETIFHPEARAALQELRAFGLVDTFRARVAREC